MTNKNVIRQTSIRRPAQPFERNLRLIGIKMGHLPFGMHTSVGAGRANEIDGMPHDLLNSTCQVFLDGGNAVARPWRRAFIKFVGGLVLPAMVVRAAVGDSEFESLHFNSIRI